MANFTSCHSRQDDTFTSSCKAPSLAELLHLDGLWGCDKTPAGVAIVLLGLLVAAHSCCFRVSSPLIRHFTIHLHVMLYMLHTWQAKSIWICFKHTHNWIAGMRMKSILKSDAWEAMKRWCRYWPKQLYCMFCFFFYLSRLLQGASDALQQTSPSVVEKARALMCGSTVSWTVLDSQWHGLGLNIWRVADRWQNPTQFPVRLYRFLLPLSFRSSTPFAFALQRYYSIVCNSTSSRLQRSCRLIDTWSVRPPRGRRS